MEVFWGVAGEGPTPATIWLGWLLCAVPVLFVTVDLSQLLVHMKLGKGSPGLPFRSARYVAGSWRPYVVFWVWDARAKALRRKVYSRIPGRDAEEKAVNGHELARRITSLLAEGYCLNASILDYDLGASLSVGDAFSRIVAVKKAEGRPRTAQSYGSFLAVFADWAGRSGLWGRPVGSVGVQDVHFFLEWLMLERGVGSRTRNNYLIYLRAVLAAAVSRGWLAENPASKVSKARTDAGKHVVYTPAERELIESYLCSEDAGLFLVTRLLYYCFLRPAEVSRLRVRDVDIPGRCIRIGAEVSKTRRPGVVYLPDALLRLLDAALAPGLPGDWYLFSRDMRPGAVYVWPTRMSERHAAALDAVGLAGGGRTLYSWKHTGAVAAVRAGVDVTAISRQMRHASLDMTRVYLRGLGLDVSEGLRGVDW